MAIIRTPIHDDDGSGHTGTIIDNAWKQELYNQIDGAIASDSATLPIDLSTDATGTLQAAQAPAHTGDVTSAAGSLALAIGTAKVTNAHLAGAIAPAKLLLLPVVLTDGASVSIDVIARAPYYRLVAAGNRTLTTPQNPLDGQKIIIQHVASGGARTLALQIGTYGFRFGTEIPALTPTESGKTDYIGCIYNLADSRWDVVAYSKGY